MPTCERCRSPIGETAHFCGHCGQTVQGAPSAAAPDRVPGRGPTDRLVLAAITFVAVLLVGGGIAAWLLTGRDAGAEPKEPPVPTTSSTPDVPATSAVPTPSSYADTPASLAAADRAQVQALTGWWVPQLSSKSPGMVVDGVTYTESRITEHALELRATYPEALVLNSADFSSYRSPGLWVVVANRAFGSAEAANAWCDTAGIGPDDCFAKRLAHDGPDGNTEPR